MKKIYTFVPSCGLASSRQIAMVNIWDSSYLLCYLIDRHMSFPQVLSEGLQNYKESKIITMLSAFCCKQVCGDIKLGEGMLLGQVYLNTWHIVPMLFHGPELHPFMHE